MFCVHSRCSVQHQVSGIRLPQRGPWLCVPTSRTVCVQTSFEKIEKGEQCIHAHLNAISRFVWMPQESVTIVCEKTQPSPVFSTRNRCCFLSTRPTKTNPVLIFSQNQYAPLSQPGTQMLSDEVILTRCPVAVSQELRNPIRERHVA